MDVPRGMIIFISPYCHNESRIVAVTHSALQHAVPTSQHYFGIYENHVLQICFSPSCGHHYYSDDEGLG